MGKREVVQRWIDEVASLSAGERAVEAHRLASKIGAFCSANEIPLDEVAGELVAAAESTGLDKPRANGLQRSLRRAAESAAPSSAAGEASPNRLKEFQEDFSSGAGDLGNTEKEYLRKRGLLNGGLLAGARRFPKYPGYSLALPMYDSSGKLRGCQFRRLSSVLDSKDGKCRSYPGLDYRGTMFMNRKAVSTILRGEEISPQLIIAEGLTDTIAACLLPHHVVGVASCTGGEAVAELPLAKDCRVYIGTDQDAAGDRYRGEILRCVSAKHPTCPIFAV